MADHDTTTPADDQQDQQQDEQAGAAQGAAPDAAADEPLGEAGKKALEAERAARRAAEKQLKELAAQVAELQKMQMSDQERAIAEAKEEARKAAMAEATQRLVRAEIKAAAAGKLADPGDAPALLGDLDRFVTDDGEVDSKAVASAIDALVKAKPYLAGAGSKAGPLPGGGAKPADGFSMDDWLRQQVAAGKGR